jgi:methylmalonyl-CoA mutase
MKQTREDLFSDFTPVSAEAWKNQILKDIKAADATEKSRIYDKQMIWRPYEGLALEPFYTAEHATALEIPPKALATWQYREWIGAADAEKASQLGREALQSGADALSFSLDALTADLSTLSAGVPASTAIYAQISKLVKHALGPDLLNQYPQVSWQYDPIQDIIDAESSAEQSFNNLTELFRSAPDRCLLSISSRYFHESGVSPAQELAFLLASLVECVHQLTERGLSVRDVLRATEIAITVDSRYFMEIAKLRALRILLAQVAGAYGEGAIPFHIHAHTAGWNKPEAVPAENLIRATIEAMAAILGTCDSLSIRIPGAKTAAEAERFRRLARNISSILREESFFGQVAEIAAGAYYVDHLTRELAQQAWALFGEIEATGGMLAHIEQGFMQQNIERARTQRETDLQTGKTVLVGVNKYP